MPKEELIINDDLMYDDEDELSTEEIKIAMVEFTKGIHWNESEIHPKTPAKKEQWIELVEEMIEAEKNGWIMEIPSDL